jgi:hypothetical protein
MMVQGIFFGQFNDVICGPAGFWILRIQRLFSRQLMLQLSHSMLQVSNFLPQELEHLCFVHLCKMSFVRERVYFIEERKEAKRREREKERE